MHIKGFLRGVFAAACVSLAVRGSDLNLTLTNAFQYSMPANSVTTLVLVP